jgi:hypothetical protein
MWRGVTIKEGGGFALDVDGWLPYDYKLKWCSCWRVQRAKVGDTGLSDFFVRRMVSKCLPLLVLYER